MSGECLRRGLFLVCVGVVDVDADGSGGVGVGCGVAGSLVGVTRLGVRFTFVGGGVGADGGGVSVLCGMGVVGGFGGRVGEEVADEEDGAVGLGVVDVGGLCFCPWLWVCRLGSSRWVSAS